MTPLAQQLALTPAERAEFIARGELAAPKPAEVRARMVRLTEEELAFIEARRVEQRRIQRQPRFIVSPA